MNPPTPPTDYSWVPWVLTAVGWPLSTFLAYRFGIRSRRLEREDAAKSAIKTRRRDFCSFLRGWKTHFDRLHMEACGYSRDGSAFVDVLPEFVQMADLVRADLVGETQKRFSELVAALAARNGGHLEDGERYEQLLKEHAELLTLTENS